MADALSFAGTAGSAGAHADGSPRSARMGPPVGSGSSGVPGAEAPREGLKEAHGAVGLPGAAGPPKKGRSAVLCVLEIFLSLIVLAAWAAYQFPKFFGERLGAVLVENPNYLSLPQIFWSTVLLVLGLVLLVDGIARCRRR